MSTIAKIDPTHKAGRNRRREAMGAIAHAVATQPLNSLARANLQGVYSRLAAVVKEHWRTSASKDRAFRAILRGRRNTGEFCESL